MELGAELGEARNYKPWKTITPRMLKSKHTQNADRDSNSYSAHTQTQARLRARRNVAGILQ